MRLTPEQITIIKSIVLELCGSGVTVRLFGSRVDDHKKGGDIDLLIESALPIKDQVMMECQLTSRLYFALGGFKVDVLIKDGSFPLAPIHERAISQGIFL